MKHKEYHIDTTLTIKNKNMKRLLQITDLKAEFGDFSDDTFDYIMEQFQLLFELLIIDFLPPIEIKGIYSEFICNQIFFLSTTNYKSVKDKNKGIKFINNFLIKIFDYAMEKECYEVVNNIKEFNTLYNKKKLK